MGAAWIEHHGTRVVSLAGFAGGVLTMVGVEFPAIGAAIGPAEGAIVAGASAALHLANRALDAFRTSAGINIPQSNIAPRQ